MDIAHAIPLYILLLVASYTDKTTGRIPNILTFPSMAVGIALNIITPLTPWLNIIIFLALCYLLSFLPGLGMGDIKMIMAAGLLAGPAPAFFAMAGACFIIWLRVYLNNHTVGKALLISAMVQPIPVETQPKTQKNTVPFAPYYMLAFIVYIGGVTLWSGS